jgi:hypothetical protein
MSKKKGVEGRPKGYHQACSICLNEKRADIELDYLHCIPWKKIEERYGIVDTSLMRHAIATGLNEKRNRKSFYYHIIENFDTRKITAENAIEAAKQLDRLEHKLVDNPQPSNIQINYLYGDKLKKNVGRVIGENRVQSAADSTEISPEQREVPPV